MPILASGTLGYNSFVEYMRNRFCQASHTTVFLNKICNDLFFLFWWILFIQSDMIFIRDGSINQPNNNFRPNYEKLFK